MPWVARYATATSAFVLTLLPPWDEIQSPLQSRGQKVTPRTTRQHQRPSAHTCIDDPHNGSTAHATRQPPTS